MFEFLSKCLSIDLEVDPKSAQIFDLAAVAITDAMPPVLASNSNLGQALTNVESRLKIYPHLIGHNIRGHDLPHLAAQRPRLAEAIGQAIDTLWLNPLAFPRNPYHHLVKHYHDGRLQSGHKNDPEQDARLVFSVLQDQLNALSRLHEQSPDATLAYHFLTTRDEAAAGSDTIFSAIRNAEMPTLAETALAVGRLLDGKACSGSIARLRDTLAAPQRGWSTAYALSWISVAGGQSVMPPWVRKNFVEAGNIVADLRDSDCRDPACQWCATNNNPTAALKRWFGFDAYRPEPVDDFGRPLQERIVDEAMHGASILGILPTGTGKSVCYQIPALNKFYKTGALTVVISPLVALMQDQVQGMARAGINSAVTVNGMLSMPERSEALDKVRMGDAAILLISPEQLRSNSVRNVLKQREVGLWVLDEAHCVSKWGHDFRPDYRYTARFIAEYSQSASQAPVLCLTATAKPEVVNDISAHFLQRLKRELTLLDGGSVRTNLSFDVRPTQRATKLSDILAVLEEKLPKEGLSGAVVYCATRKETERVADFLKQGGYAAEHFHAGLTPEAKRIVQEDFRVGRLRVIAATNAFGMGIDKPDIRLVVHGDIPGSLENYLQEAGRAGRDRLDADCVLLYAHEDVERQFQLTARSRLAHHEIKAILKSVRHIDQKTKKNGLVTATAGEIVRAEKDKEFTRDSATDDTRVKTAVSWLEEAKLLQREENRVSVFPSSVQVKSVDAAKAVIDGVDMTLSWRKNLLSLVTLLLNTPADEGVSTDDLAGHSGLSGAQLNKALADLETLGLVRNDIAITAFVHLGREGSSSARLKLAASLEVDLIAAMREASPDAERDETLALNLAEVTQHLRNQGHKSVRPDLVEKLLQGMAFDGRDQEGGRGNIRLRKETRNSLAIALQRSWQVVEGTANLRRQAAGILLNHFLGKLDSAARGKDLQVESTMGDLLAQLTSDALLRTEIRDFNKVMERALLWLHEQEILTLGKGLTVFRSAMTLQLANGAGGFNKEHFQPLEEHYTEQTVQTHVMAAYAEKGLAGIGEAVRLSEDYFVLDKSAFIKRWMPGRLAEMRRQTTGTSWLSIVDSLGNPVQQEIVRDDREQTNVLVLAGPGSGKTRVLVHRIAYLIRVKREDPNGILVLTYNRHAAAEIQMRLRHLIGDDAFGVTISTCHALAMRLMGVSFTAASTEERDFDGIVMNAVKLLEGEGLSKQEADAQRDLLIQGYRWMLVDEYQDIGPEEYALIAALAGRSKEDEDSRLSLFAVGDDDQNIYAFAGASIRYIRQFKEDYAARPQYLTDNYRSTQNIIAAANGVIALAADRMKADHAIQPDPKRRKDAAGGVFAALDPVAQGRVQVLDVEGGERAQAMAAVDELVRLSRLDPQWSWSDAAIIGRQWKPLQLVHAYAESLGIEVSLANEAMPSVWRLRETQALVARLKASKRLEFTAADVLAALNTIPQNEWTNLLAEGVALLMREIAQKAMPLPDLIEWLAEWAREVRGEQQGLLLLTAHRSKGLEFKHVVILDGGWKTTSKGEDADAPRRLFYVAMTRARETLSIIATGGHAFASQLGEEALHRRVQPALEAFTAPAVERVMPNLKLADLSWPGRQGASIRTSITAATVGDPLHLRQEKEAWMLYDGQDRPVGKMARRFTLPDGLAVLSVRVGAIVQWRKSDNDEMFRQHLRYDDWEVILPDITLSA